jgi:hypothetical protein
MLIVSIILTIAELLTNKNTHKRLRKGDLDNSSKIILFLFLHYVVYFILYFTLFFILSNQSNIAIYVYFIYGIVLVSVLLQWALLNGRCILTEISNSQLELTDTNAGFRDPYNIITGTYPKVTDKSRNFVYYSFLYSVSTYSFFKFFIG